MRVYRAALVYQRKNKNIASVYRIIVVKPFIYTAEIIISGSVDRCLSYCFGLIDGGMTDIKTFIVDSFKNDMSMNNWSHLNINEAKQFYTIG